MDSLADVMIERGLVSRLDVDRIIEVGARTGSRFVGTVARLGLMGEDELSVFLAEAFELPLIAGVELPQQIELGWQLNPRFLAKRAIAPIGESEGHIILAMADPSDADSIEAIRFATGRNIEVKVGTFSDIIRLVKQHADAPADAMDGALAGTATAAVDIERLLEEESEAPVIRLVQRLIGDAALQRASDIHIEPMARYLAVRFRVDGRLIEIERLSDSLAGPIARRIKVMSALDIAESRLPQDGRLRATVRGRDIDIRVSTSPTAWGEAIVMRLLARTEVPLDLDRLGLPATALAALIRALERPHGIILLTGPTGSGKTTTLYAALNRLRRPEVKILTVEDPVEILIEGINQVQVRPEIELSYAATLRAFLRQDPDILMIGEIRDHETAEIAMRAALTGHLVLSTLHTNSAIGAFTRLADIGIEPYLTASTVIATVAQRLIRSLCETCRHARSITGMEASQFEQAGLTAPETVYEPAGCSACQHTGFLGRLPLIEVLEVDDALRAQIRDGQAEHIVDRRSAGDTLMGHGLALVAAGRTSLGEVQRAVHLA